MPGMNGNDMGDAVVAAIAAVNPNADETFLKTYWEPICTAIVTYIQANATVLPGTMEAGGNPVTGVGTVD